MPEYGRHIQKMVDYLKTIEDPVKRQKNAQVVIELMGALNPHLRIVEDFRHMLWDHLFLIADFDLDIESPYPKPTRDKLDARPAPLPYPIHTKKLKHLGKNLNALLDKALVEKDEEKRKGYTSTIAYYMKLAYVNWHHEPVHDDMIKEELKEISKGDLVYEEGDIKVKYEAHAFNNNGHKRNGKNFKNGNGSGNRNHNKNNHKPKRKN